MRSSASGKQYSANRILQKRTTIMKKMLLVITVIVAAVFTLLLVIRSINRSNAGVTIVEQSKLDDIIPRLSSQGYDLVKILGFALQHHEREVRMRAAWALGETGDPRAIKHLAPALIDFSELVQSAAEKAVIKIGPQAVPALIDLVHTRGKSVNSERFARVVAAMGDESTLPPLQEMLESGSDLSKGYAARALGALGDKRATGMLIKAVVDDSTFAAQMAVQALGQLRAEEAVAALTPLVTDGTKSLRIEAIRALGAIGSKASVAALISALHSSEREIVRAVVKALGKIGDPAALRPLFSLIKSRHPVTGEYTDDIDSALIHIGIRNIDSLAVHGSDLDYRVRRYVMLLAGYSGNLAAVPLLKKGVADPHPLVRKQAIRSLASYPTTSVAAVLRDALHDTNIDIRSEAIRTLGHSGDRASIPELLRIVRSGYANGAASLQAIAPWQAAAIALGHMKVTKAVPLLIEALSTQAAPRPIRCSAALALGEIGDKRALAELTSTVLEHAPRHNIEKVIRWDVRGYAAAALGGMKAPTVPATLIKALQRSDPGDIDFRIDLVKSLSMQHSKESVPVLIPLLNHPDQQLVAETKIALRSISGRNFGDDVAAWQSWWKQLADNS
ncbi:MAG: hypothetical protein GF398_01935 [Chitinivibrionales bacterium]|nr:hypothetical protein [Chitinivibrionales bacterium]